MTGEHLAAQQRRHDVRKLDLPQCRHERLFPLRAAVHAPRVIIRLVRDEPGDDHRVIEYEGHYRRPHSIASRSSRGDSFFLSLIVLLNARISSMTALRSTSTPAFAGTSFAPGRPRRGMVTSWPASAR